LDETRIKEILNNRLLTGRLTAFTFRHKVQLSYAVTAMAASSTAAPLAATELVANQCWKIHQPE